MLVRPRTAALLFAVALLGASPLCAQTALGSIEGQVVDANNNTVPGASVYPVTGPAGTGKGSTVLTNADGRFRLENLVPGTYKLSIYKLEDGYADPSIPFYADPEHPLPVVTVTSATQTSNQSFQLGARCGTLHINASDATTHHSIGTATVILHQRNNGSAVLQATNKELPADFLVPPQDVTIALDAPGYVTWRFSEDDHNYVTLRPGDSRSIRAEMQPVATGPTTPPK
jgi:hypothetical protein